jgi:hypothetical protein
MGFYVRKRLRAGPFRFNLSKSGLGVSAGVPGFRVGTGPRGNYVHVGKGGVSSVVPARLGALPATTEAGHPSRAIRTDLHDIDRSQGTCRRQS